MSAYSQEPTSLNFQGTFLGARSAFVMNYLDHNHKRAEQLFFERIKRKFSWCVSCLPDLQGILFTFGVSVFVSFIDWLVFHIYPVRHLCSLQTYPHEVNQNS